MGRVHPAVHAHRLDAEVDNGPLPAEFHRRSVHRLSGGCSGRSILCAASDRAVLAGAAVPAERLFRGRQGMKGISVRLEGLTKHFGQVVALRTLDLDIRAGEMVAFLGPSGCGKTTTLLMIAGIYRPTAGQVFFAERRVDHLPPRDRDVGMVFQTYALYPHITLFENIAFPLRLKGRPQTEVSQKVQQTAA